MEYIKSRNHDLTVSRIGFGCCPMGLHGWGDVTRDEVVSAARMALDNGVTLFDTADIYGLGISERLLGESLGKRRSEAVIATKFGVRRSNDGHTYYDNSASWLDHALDASLKRLATDYIDIYQVHYLDKETPLEATIDILERKCDEGKIRFYGISNVDDNDLKLLPNAKNLVSFQGQYSLVHRDTEDAAKHIHNRLGLIFLTWGSLAQGLLSGKYDTQSSFGSDDRRSRSEYKDFHGDVLRENLVFLRELKKISERLSCTMTQLALRWIIDTLNFSVPLVGIKNTQQALDSVSALDCTLTTETLNTINTAFKSAKASHKTHA